MSINTRLLGASCSTFVLLGFASPASAQASGEQGASANVAIEEVVVTAQRRSERVQDVPISLTVADQAALERAGVENLIDLPLITPGLKIDRFAISTQPTLRGITTRENSPGNDPNVAIYVDGVYQASQQSNGFDLPDVVQVEVAKGPQGTLFGRNATGGAILITTAVPTYDFGGKFTASYGRFDDKMARGWVNIPLAEDKAALNLAAYYSATDGYYNDLLNGGTFGARESSLLRGKLLLEPTDKVKLLFMAQYSQRDDDVVGGGSPLNGNSVGRNVPGAIVPTRPYDVAFNGPAYEVKNVSLSLKADADLGFASLTSITAYNDVDIDLITEGDFTSATIQRFVNKQPSKAFSQELTLTSNSDGRLSWVVGGLFFDNNAKYDPLGIENNGVIAIRRFARQEVRAYAGFAEATFKITDRLTAIGGLRYSYETHSLFGHTGDTTPDAKLNKKSWDRITPRLSLRYEVNPDTNVYATYSEGFKSGGFNTAGLGSIKPFDEEVVKSLEVGLKSAPLPSVRFNIAGFYYDYSGQQVLTIVTAGTAQVQVTNNAASSELYGVDADAQWRVTPELTINAALSLLHTKYTSYRAAVVQVPRLVGGVVCNCGNVAATLDVTGNGLIRAPDYSFTIGATYRKELDAGTLELSGSVYYSDDYVFTSDERIGQDGYENVSARIAFEPAGTKLRLSLWGRNLTDVTVIEGTSILPNGDGVWYAAPRTYGVQLDYQF